MKRKKINDVWDWIYYGVEHGYCLPVRCLTHDSFDSNLFPDDFDYEDGCMPFLQLIDKDDE